MMLPRLPYSVASQDQSLFYIKQRRKDRLQLLIHAIQVSRILGMTRIIDNFFFQ